MAQSSVSGFDFHEGDRLLVRVREHGTSGNIIAKFEAECVSIRDGITPVSSPTARLRLPWGDDFELTTLKPYEAEFEVIDDE